MSSWNIVEVKTKRDLKEYIQFPFSLYKNDISFTPPLLIDEYDYYNLKKNKLLNSNPHILYLVKDGSKVLGRCMGLINVHANELRSEKVARFNWLDTIDSCEIQKALLERLEKWAKDQGMDSLIGPRGFTDQEPQGALVEGFDSRSAVGTIYNRAYLNDYIQKNGYQKVTDWVSYQFSLDLTLPFKHRNFESIKVKGKVAKIVHLKTKKDLKKLLVPVFECVNRSYAHLYGFHAITEEEMHAAAKKYLPILDPRLIKAYEVDGKIIAFIVSMSDVTEGLKKAHGRLLPFGWYHLKKSLDHADILQMLLIGVDPDYQTGVLMMGLLAELQKEVNDQKRFKILDSHLNLEDNTAVRKILERLGGQVTKRYRVFKKDLTH